MPDGSRWYFPVFEGLLDAKHLKQMGMAIWLYAWILARAWANQSNGAVQYSHTDACQGLGVCDKTVRLWFKTLQEYGYLIIRARHPHHLEVEVSKWRSVEEWLESRHTERSVIRYRSGVEIGNVIGNENGKILPLSLLTIKLLSYEYSSPGGRSGNLADAFRGLMAVLRETHNKAPVLQALHMLCFGGDAPECGYLAKVAKTVGGAGRLAEIMWQLTTRPPTGDVLAYILATHKREGRERNNGHGETPAFSQGLTEEQKRMNAIALGKEVE